MRFSRLQIGRNRKLDNFKGPKFFKIEIWSLKCALTILKELIWVTVHKYAIQIGRTFLTMGKITPCILKRLTYLY